jgi:hypothetical protein
MVARLCCLAIYRTWLMPRTWSGRSAGRVIGPGAAAAPGASCGKVVDMRCEGDVALHFLHDLMNVAVEHRHRAKTPDRVEPPQFPSSTSDTRSTAECAQK